MALSGSDIAQRVIDHLLEITAGTCSITHEMIEAVGDDRAMCEILTGLLYLHEDLVLRARERERAEGELRAAVDQLATQNNELDKSRAEIAALVAELSTPILRVWESVLMMPLVGTIDHARAADIMESLLSAVVAERALFTVLDVTGVTNIDTATADQFLRIIRALKLLGATGVIAGVQPSVSLAITGLGVDLAGIKTFRNARDALVYCMRGGSAPSP
jgi:rsbT co-antagonist protein RsbR